ncbi:hypothetical protein RRG08_009458 [Elysia crispata]|uniref:Uncharacterized protein n=1 Tax=Elysia crispata TaxID=231223 RepID=A0AAE0YWY0_9GAST|nr:hypothetical protein RRG08_009458 [Elysia crispata]
MTAFPPGSSYRYTRPLHCPRGPSLWDGPIYTETVYEDGQWGLCQSLYPHLINWRAENTPRWIQRRLPMREMRV